MRQQDLSRANVVALETFFVGFHNAHLSDSGCCLEFVHFFRTFGPAETSHSFCNRTGANPDDLFAHLLQLGDLSRPSRNRFRIHSMTFVRHQRRSYFYDNSFCIVPNLGVFFHLISSDLVDGNLLSQRNKTPWSFLNVERVAENVAFQYIQNRFERLSSMRTTQIKKKNRRDLVFSAV